MKVTKPKSASWKGLAAATAGAAVVGVTAWLMLR